MDDQTVVIMGKIKALAIRMKRVLEGSRICVIDTDNEYKLYNSIQKSKASIRLVLLDLDIEGEFAISLLKETRGRLENIPVIMITPPVPETFLWRRYYREQPILLLSPLRMKCCCKRSLSIWRLMRSRRKP